MAQRQSVQRRRDKPQPCAQRLFEQAGDGDDRRLSNSGDGGGSAGLQRHALQMHHAAGLQRGDGVIAGAEARAAHQQDKVRLRSLEARLDGGRGAISADAQRYARARCNESPPQERACRARAIARWRIEASLHEVELAKKQFYPNINLAAAFGLNSVGLGNLGAGNTDQWSVGPAIRLPLFDGGRLRANLRGKATEVDAAIEAYNVLVLDAAHEAADQWVSAAAIQQQQGKKNRIVFTKTDLFVSD